MYRNGFLSAIAMFTNYEFLIPTAIAIISTIISILEYLRRQKAEVEVKESMLEIIDKLNKLNRLRRKSGDDQKGRSKQSEIDKEIKSRRLQLQQDKFNHKKLKDYGKFAKWILDNIDVDD